MKRFLFFFVLMIGLSLSLVACQAAPAATPTETATAEPAAVEPTAEPVVVPTLPPTWTPTPLPPPTAAIPPTPADTPTPEATPTPAPVDVWVDAADGLNLRAEAKADAALVTTLKHQQHLAALAPATAPDAGGIAWQNVRADDGKTGWVSAQYLTTTKPVTSTLAATVIAVATTAATSVPTATIAAATPSTTTAPVGDVWVIATNGLNLRAEPNTTAAVLAVLQYGQRLKALAPQTAPDAGGIAWQNVRSEANQTGWAAAASLSTTAPVTATVSPTATVTGANAASELLRRINELRRQNRLAALEFSPQLTAAAQAHSLDMAKTGNVSQTGSDGSAAGGRMQAAGYTGERGEELVAGGQVTIDDVWNAWVSNHQAANAILNPKYIRVGIAVANGGGSSYYTIDFGGP